jgi:hypothetical protein
MEDSQDYELGYATPKQHIGLSNKTDQWFTPPEIINRVSQVFNHCINLDPCGSTESNRIVQASKVIAENSIDTDWGIHRNVFCNPPSGKYSGATKFYKGLSNPQAFFKKLNYGVDNWQIEQYIYLGYSIEQLQTLQTKTTIPRDCLICIPAKRIRFVDQSSNRNSPTHGNCIIYRGQNQSKFVYEFQDLGVILELF